MRSHLFPLLLAIAVTFTVAACDDARPAGADAGLDDMELVDAVVVDLGHVDARVDDTGFVDAADALDPPGPHAVPARGPMSGYYPVTFPVVDLDPAAIVAVTVAGVAAYGVEATVDGVRAVVQGAPTPGPATVEVTTADGVTHDLGALFTYEPPLDPRFTRIVAFGGGLGQGLQRGVPSARGALLSPPAQLARRLGGFMPLPIPVDGAFVPMSLADLGPPPVCASPDVTTFVLARARAAVDRFADADGAPAFHRARVDPDIRPANVASGNVGVHELLAGPRTPSGRILSHFVHDPSGAPLDRVARPQINELRPLEPTLVVSFDFFSKDLINNVAGPELIPWSELSAETLDTMMMYAAEQLGALGVPVFLADLPRPSLLPCVAMLRARAAAEGEEARVFFVAHLAQIDAAAELANDLLRRYTRRFAQIHVVPLAERFEAIAEQGLVIGGEALSMRRFGGLIGLDGVHYTETGYAIVADLFVEHIGATLGIELPRIDIAAVLAADPERPSALAAAGFDRDACLR
ncbi:MAG: hypothetical protein H6703_08555 [Myxococcales bacterium]|nr:hypothetical protein [Myxococcales bacterium]MCB9552428.1 hypothetical protein [Myxococcales bacterium]